MKSGGHAPNERSSSAEGGVTIDMRLFDAVEYLGDDGEGEVTRIGTGRRWGEVYKKLEPLGKTVVGGRDQRVGVGGFMLGGKIAQHHLQKRIPKELIIKGGISFISRRYGWAIDNVRNYEVRPCSHLAPTFSLTDQGHPSKRHHRANKPRLSP